MAGASRLNAPQRRRLLGLAAAVVLAHLAALQWFSRWQAAQASLLKPMVAPLYTRVLQPEQPPPVVAPPVVAAPAPPPKPTVRAVPSTPKESTTTVAEANPERVEPPLPEPAAPQPAPPAVAAADPQPAASAPAEAAPAAPPAVAAASAPATDPLASWPADTRLRYRLSGQLRGGPLDGSARVLWQRDGSRYEVRVEVDVQWFGSVVMTSQGEVHPDGLRPQVYEETRRGRPRGLRIGDREVQLAGGRAIPRPAGVQDTASQFVELTHRFATGREVLEVGRAVTFWMARPGAIDLWTYDVAAREVLDTRMGPIDAFHLRPRPIANPRGNITAEMWFAPALRHMPVKIRVRMGEEDFIDLLVEGIDQR
ncbi:MAG TPA: DUF3108 domain-containing protein [Ramlibacter sp.]|nr:DUF3108 domain-containing protein [Ramlibacter sp.]